MHLVFRVLRGQDIGSVSDHTKSEEQNAIDPDDGVSWSCGVCKLPIFSTPFVEMESGNNTNYIHDHCASLPLELASDVHPKRPLLLVEVEPSRPECGACKAQCGSIVYRCPDSDCNMQLDVLCALPSSIRILHRSHHHRLMAICGSTLCSYLCVACGTKHDQETSTSTNGGSSRIRVYVCSACSFWLHPWCASLPNAIFLKKNPPHPHPLLLYYNHPHTHDRFANQAHLTCSICGNMITSLGLYSCNKCRYYAHIMCAVSNSTEFDPVLIREAHVPDLAHFPIPDEYTSIIRHIRKDIIITSEDDKSEELHPHPLILELESTDNNKEVGGVCNACVEFISPPFYRCTECPDFFLHDSCAHLPRKLDGEYRLDPHLPPDSIVYCSGCSRKCNGFTYFRDRGFGLISRWDVVCALMPASFTHEAHGKSHILYPRSYDFPKSTHCDCCGQRFSGEVIYECWTCHGFRIHPWCAHLPNMVTHKYDPHPLNLITTKHSQGEGGVVVYCEFCEEEIKYNKRWYYGCSKCEQSFHTKCIPSLDDLSRIKCGPSKTIRVKSHGCRVSLARGREVWGSRCGYCKTIFNEGDPLVWECSKCYFRIHLKCANSDIDNSNA